MHDAIKTWDERIKRPASFTTQMLAMQAEIEELRSENERLNHKDKLITKWQENGELIERLYGAGIQQEREISELQERVAELESVERGEPYPCRSLLAEWEEGLYDGQDFLRRVRLALHGPLTKSKQEPISDAEIMDLWRFDFGPTDEGVINFARALLEIER